MRFTVAVRIWPRCDKQVHTYEELEALRKANRTCGVRKKIRSAGKDHYYHHATASTRRWMDGIVEALEFQKAIVGPMLLDQTSFRHEPGRDYKRKQ